MMTLMVISAVIFAILIFLAGMLFGTTRAYDAIEQDVEASGYFRTNRFIFRAYAIRDLLSGYSGVPKAILDLEEINKE